MMSGMTSNEFDALLERRRELEASIRRARGVLSRKPSARLEAACDQAVRRLVEVRAQIEAELDEVRRRARRLRAG